MLKPPVQFAGDSSTPGPELPDGAHGEVDKWGNGRRFVCVQARGACVEIEHGDWILYDESGEAYPLPLRFMKAIDLLLLGELANGE